ncbi:hypothetical protein [Streptomyces sp. NPDC026673]|uniref:hypothetical protein n=1 Tax=Streptomyces sp. NPDC026673 TaxID=3155724 RepID=UPI00340041D7
MPLQLLARLRAPVRPSPGVVLAGAVLAILASLAGPAPSAAAHPFGPPSTAQAGVQGSRLVIAWNTDKLDWVALGESLGVFGGRDSGGNSSNLSFAQRLQRSTAVRDYLLRHIAVAQAGRPCHGTVVGGMEDFLARGAQVAFDCPAPVVDVQVTISALTDLHPAYRTMLTSAGPAEPQQTLFTSARPTTQVRFTASGGSVRGTVVAFSIGTFAAALAIGGFVLRRSRRRKGARAGSTPISVHHSQTAPGKQAAAPADTGARSRSNA